MLTNISQCYMGKKRLESGISLYKSAHPGNNDTFTITWYPYYLDPNASSVGIDKRAFYKSRFGESRSAMMFAKMESLGKAVGINFRFGGKTGATRDSHRILHLAKTKGADLQNRVVEQLFEAYFENEEDITSHEVLIRRAVKAGLEEDEVKGWLESGAGGHEVDKVVEEARSKGITGVPYFTVQGYHNIEGAQDADGFARVFESIKAREKES